MVLFVLNSSQPKKPLLWIISLLFLLFNFIFFGPPNCMAKSVDPSNDVDLGNVVITATRLKEDIEKVPASITIITKEDIAKRGAITIDEVLRDVPGVNISRYGTIGGESFPSVRGADKRHLLIMIDGVVVNPTFDDVFDFSDYHVDNIERIEIVRGSYSSLYGSDAIGGVINIITKQPKPESKHFVSIEGGSFYTFRELVGINKKRKKLGLTLSAARTDSRGNYARDEYENNTFSGNLIYDLSDNSRLNYITRYIKTKKNIPIIHKAILGRQIQPQVVFSQKTATRRESFINSLVYENIVSDLWDFNIKASHFNFHDIEDDEEEKIVNLPLLFYQTDIQSTRYTIETQHNIYIKEIDTITTGIILEREEASYRGKTNLTTGSLFPKHEAFKKHRINKGFYLQNIFNWNESFIFIAGGRIDHFDYIGSIFSPKLSFSYSIKQTYTKVKGSYGRGYHVPSFDQLYSIPFGNIGLNPEKSTSYEIGIDQSLKNNALKIGATYFKIDFKEKIVPDLMQFKYINLEKSCSKGIELYLNIYPTNELKFKINYTRTYTENKETGEELASIPRYTLNFNTDYNPIDDFNVVMDINFVGSEFNPSDNVIGLDNNPLGSRNPSYAKVDLSASYILLKNWYCLKTISLYGYIQNLLNNDYTEVFGSPNPGINFLLGLKANL